MSSLEEDQATAREDLPEMPPLKILLAEDSPVNQKLAVALLSKYGHQVTVVDNGREAVALSRRTKFDLILMDVQMPEMDGLEAAQAIREFESRGGQHVPIIAMTAHAMKGDRQLCLEAGMDDYVSKPIRPSLLLQTMNSAFSNSSGRHEKSEESQAGEPTPISPDDQAKGLAPPSRASPTPPATGTSTARTNDGEPVQAAAETDAVPAATLAQDAIDWQVARQTVMGDESLLRELAATFAAQIPESLQALQEALQKGDAKTFQREAHTLKSGLGHFGAKRAYEMAYRLELMGHAGSLDDAPETFSSLRAEVSSVRAILGQFLENRRE
jgi:CheY-like chemotaxis protein